MAWLGTIARRDATGELGEAYAAMAARRIPDAYKPPHDDAPGIVLAHSLDAELLRRTFAMSGALHGVSLDWSERELLSSVTSRTNQCFY
ncbi:MAG TPA: hypothetical protein VGD67_26910 [Pseudonocardiaceae bacterium]